MYASIYLDPDRDGVMVIRLRALKMGNFYLCSDNFGSYEFRVPIEWNAHAACVAILETLSEDREKPIELSLGEEPIRIDPIIADELFDCLVVFTSIKDHQ